MESQSGVLLGQNSYPPFLVKKKKKKLSEDKKDSRMIY